MMDDLLERMGLKYEELKPAERETYHTWLETLSQKPIAPDDIKKYIRQMKESLEMELSKTDPSLFHWFFGWKRDFAMKARLRNYILLESFLDGPERAKHALAAHIEQLASKRGKLDSG